MLRENRRGGERKRAESLAVSCSGSTGHLQPVPKGQHRPCAMFLTTTGTTGPLYGGWLRMEEPHEREKGKRKKKKNVDAAIGMQQRVR